MTVSPLVNRSRNSLVEGDNGDDDDVVFIESTTSFRSCAPVIADQRHFVFPASKSKASRTLFCNSSFLKIFGFSEGKYK